jgi:hypothetical protein
VGVPHAAYFLTCLSAFPRQARSCCLLVQDPSWFLSVMGHGEALCNLGFGVSEFCFFLGVFLPSVAPVSQKDFCLMELTLSASSL